MDSCTHTSPLIDIQPKKREFLCLRDKFYRTAIIENLLNADAQDAEGVSAQ